MHVILRRYANPGRERERERERDYRKSSIKERRDRILDDYSFLYTQEFDYRYKFNLEASLRHFYRFETGSPGPGSFVSIRSILRVVSSLVSSIVFRLLAIDKRRLRQFTKTTPPSSLLPSLFKCRINLLSFQQSSLIINETHARELVVRN